MSSPQFHISQRLSLSNQLCTIRYIGPVQGTSGTWLGVEWDNPDLGKHPGRHNDVEYFKCLSPSSTAGSFIRPTRPSDRSRSFLDALRDKYVADNESDNPRDGQRSQIYFNGKLAEEIGFEKVAKQQAALNELRIVVLDGQKIAGLQASHNGGLKAGKEWNDLVEEIKTTCGNIVELDLSRNLFESWSDVVGICSGLKHLKRLVLSRNRFYSGPARSDAGLVEVQRAFENLEELLLDGTLLTWEEIVALLTYFPSLKTLSLASNELKGPFSGLPRTNLVKLTLSFNPLQSLAAIAPLSTLTHLTTLVLASCSISILPILATPFPTLQHMDLSSNTISSLTDLSSLPVSFPNLASLRCSNNLFYNNLPVDEAHVLTLARIPSISMLNYSKITVKEREDGELWYLSKVRAQIVSDQLNENQLKGEHPLWKQLSEKYNQEDDFAAALEKARSGEQEEKLINPNSLGARLIDITAYLPASPGRKELTLRIPKTITVPRLKSIIGRQIGILPMKFKLIYETGELDPVAQNLGHPGRVGEGWKFIDTESDSGDEEANKKDTEKWVKREIDLGESPRPFGYWLDGKTARIRIEVTGSS